MVTAPQGQVWESIFTQNFIRANPCWHTCTNATGYKVKTILGQVNVWECARTLGYSTAGVEGRSLSCAQLCEVWECLLGDGDVSCNKMNHGTWEENKARRVIPNDLTIRAVPSYIKTFHWIGNVDIHRVMHTCIIWMLLFICAWSTSTASNVIHQLGFRIRNVLQWICVCGQTQI